MSSHHRSGRRWSCQCDAAAARSMASRRRRRPTCAESQVSGGVVPDSTRRHSSSLMATAGRTHPALVSAPRSSGWCPRPAASARWHAPRAPRPRGHPHHHASAAKRWPTTLSLSSLRSTMVAATNHLGEHARVRGHGAQALLKGRRD
jgi:hypothetical protein